MAGIAAVAIVVVVVVGFVLHPQKSVFYLRTTVVKRSGSVEHNRIAVRVELARLWLLFLPTFGALAFLIVTSAKGTTWRFSLLERFFQGSYLTFYGIRIFLGIVFGLLTTWLSERWVLRHADACTSVDYLSIVAGRILYGFKDSSDEYYGGEAFPFGRMHSAQSSGMVFYCISKPRLNKLAMGCLFHRFVIIGRGLTEFDADTAAVQSLRTQPAGDAP